jgi:hypothetical protein
MSATNEVTLSRQGNGSTLNKDILVTDRRDWGFLLEFQGVKAATAAENPLLLSLGNHFGRKYFYEGSEKLRVGENLYLEVMNRIDFQGKPEGLFIMPKCT